MHSELERSLQRLMLGVRADWALYVKYTGSGETIAVNADDMMDTMSVIKIPLLVTLFRLYDTDRLNLDHKLVLETRFKRFGSWCFACHGRRHDLQPARCRDLDDHRK